METIEEVLLFDDSKIPQINQTHEVFRANAQVSWNRMNPVLRSFNAATAVINKSYNDMVSFRNDTEVMRDDTELFKNKVESYVIPDEAIVRAVVEDRETLRKTIGKVGAIALQKDIALNYEWVEPQLEDNGGTIINVDGDGSGSWKAIYYGAVNVKWFGAKETELQMILKLSKIFLITVILIILIWS